MENVSMTIQEKSCRSYSFLLSLFSVVLVFGLAVEAEQLAFPGAEGYGAYSKGGRGGDVYHVTNLSDDPCNPRQGSLRYGVRTAGGTAGSPRTIVFDISGNIQLMDVLDINKSYLTIAGQTAPKGGISIARRQVQIGSGQYTDPPSIPTNPIDTTDVIVRHIRCRFTPYANSLPGYLNDPNYRSYPEDEDAFRVINCQNTIIDHISSTWGHDEVLSITGRSTNVTVQWCLPAEVLHSHAKATLLRQWINSYITFHHNLYVNDEARTPRFGNYNGVTTQYDWYNNVNYNWYSRNAYSNNNGYCHNDFGPYGTVNCVTGEHVHLNYIKNYMIAGPGSTGPKMTYGTAIGDFSIFWSESTPNQTEIWVDGNVSDGDKDGNFDGIADAAGDFKHVFESTRGSTVFRGTSFTITAPVKIESAYNALLRVLDGAGASYGGNRDTLDARLVKNIIDANGPTWVNSSNWIVDERSGGGLPAIEPNSRPSGFDTDLDGMPNAWETARWWLNPNNANDRNLDRDSDGYTNLEEYLNYIVLITDSTPGDFDDDGDVGVDDLAAFLDDWLVEDTVYVPAGDLDGDKNVDFKDFAIFAGNWSG